MSKTLHIDIIDGKCEHGKDIYAVDPNEPDGCRRCREDYAAWDRAYPLAESLSNMANRSSADLNMLARAIANDHPTLIGQIAKTIGIAVMRRAVYNPTWKPGQETVGDKGAARYCPLDNSHGGGGNTIHPEHDGRLNCSTVIGAYLMSLQSFI